MHEEEVIYVIATRWPACQILQNPTFGPFKKAFAVTLAPKFLLLFKDLPQEASNPKYVLAHCWLFLQWPS